LAAPFGIEIYASLLLGLTSSSSFCTTCNWYRGEHRANMVSASRSQVPW